MPKWVRPGLKTKFHIDFDWWEQKGLNFRIHLLSHLCADCRARYESHHETELIDWVDPDTAEVTRVDGLWHSLRTCCSLKPDYIAATTPLATAVFRVFLANGNAPLTPEELHEHLGNRPAEAILGTIGGLRVYNGIKPLVHKPRALRGNRLNTT